MAKHLQQLTLLLNRYLNHRRIVFTGDGAQVLFLQGEARLRLAFFQALTAQNIHDARSQYLLWQKLMLEKSAIIEVCEHSGLADFANLNQQAANYPQQCWFCYCVLFACAVEEDYQALVQALSVGFVQHYLPVLFPKAKPVSELAQLQKQLNEVLAQKYGQKVLVKESFKATAAGVDFQLLIKLPNQKPLELISLHGKRLKSARLAAYQQAVESL